MNEEPTGWLDEKMEDASFRRLYEREKVIESFLNRIQQVMDRQSVTRAELARRMECSAANITQLMRRTTNLTVATMVDLAFSLDQKVTLSIMPKSVNACLFGWHNGLAMNNSEVLAANNSELAETAPAGLSLAA
jgi:transcriptional regulator with XRE-family HTH domain